MSVTYVYLPSDYQTGNNSYPVIYVLDAQIYLFKPAFHLKDRILNEGSISFNSGFDGEAIVVGIESNSNSLWDETAPG